MNVSIFLKPREALDLEPTSSMSVSGIPQPAVMIIPVVVPLKGLGPVTNSLALVLHEALRDAASHDPDLTIIIHIGYGLH